MTIVSSVAGSTPYTPISASDNFTTTALNQILAGEQSASSVATTTGGTEAGSGSPGASSSFDAILSSLLPTGAKGEVNEEQLFASLIEERLTTLKGEGAAKSYHQLFEAQKSAMTRSGGNVPVEDAARAALRELTDQGTLSTDEAEAIHAQAFQAAQIDENTGALYDSFGTTMAVTLVDLALSSSEEMMTKFDSGELDAGRLSLDYSQDQSRADFVGGSSSGSTPASAGFVGGDGFLFKPVSEGNGKLVVLLPPTMSQQVESVSIVGSSGQVIENGQSYGDYEDGRPLFRFDQAGNSYPNNITVTVAMLDGTERAYNIANPAQRYE